MERLYLIRVGMERFLGPYTLKQVQEAYHKMQFGLQDEISGSLRQWVTFDNIEGIRRHYPELVQLIHSEMMSGWGMQVAQSGAQANARMRLGGGTGLHDIPQSKAYLWVLALIVALAGILAFFSYQDGGWVNPISYLKERTYYQARSYLGDRYNPRFEGFMDRNRSEISLAMKKKKAFTQWIPYVRSVAFSKDGRWEGLSPKKLRGQTEAFLPSDCSSNAWDDRWRDSRLDWQFFLEGRRLPREDWSRILMMDPQWVKTRSPMPGWMDPGSYHEACLRMALKSLVRLNNEDPTGEANVIISRLRWQLGEITGNSPSAEFEMSGVLWAMSCLEDAHQSEDLRNCFNSVKVKGAFQDYFEARVLMRKLALLVADENQHSEASLREIQGYVNAYASKASLLFMDYEAELHFYKEIIQQRGSVKAAKASAHKKYPNVKFDP